jgi:hypothetical protein
MTWREAFRLALVITGTLVTATVMVLGCSVVIQHLGYFAVGIVPVIILVSMAVSFKLLTSTGDL